MDEEQNLRILLADDDPSIVHLYRVGLPRYFEGVGTSAMSELESELFGEKVRSRQAISVTVCHQGNEAVDLANQASQSGTPFDVIILDVRMPPGIDGVKAAERIREFDSAAPIIFVSGYSSMSIQDVYERVPPPELVWFLDKPVQLTQLAEMIRKVAA